MEKREGMDRSAGRRTYLSRLGRGAVRRWYGQIGDEARHGAIRQAHCLRRGTDATRGRNPADESGGSAAAVAQAAGVACSRPAVDGNFIIRLRTCAMRVRGAAVLMRRSRFMLMSLARMMARACRVRR